MLYAARIYAYSAISRESENTIIGIIENTIFIPSKMSATMKTVYTIVIQPCEIFSVFTDNSVVVHEKLCLTITIEQPIHRKPPYDEVRNDTVRAIAYM